MSDQRPQREPERRWIDDAEELGRAMLWGGPLLAALVAWRLYGISKERLYDLVKRGKMSGVWVKGVLHVFVRECEERWPVHDDDGAELGSDPVSLSVSNVVVPGSESGHEDAGSDGN